MDRKKHYESITKELEALKDRVRNLIDNAHWLTDGEWKEIALRSMIEKALPASVKIGRGFIITKNGPTTQCDILLYRADCPILFRDADLVFLTPDSVLGIVEVKSKLDKTSFMRAIRKLAAVRFQLGDACGNLSMGIFSYEIAGNDPSRWISDVLTTVCTIPNRKIDLINLGCSSFTKWWDISPVTGQPGYSSWHNYKLEYLSAGYFIANLVDAVSGGLVSKNDSLWFPEGGKEPYLKKIIPAPFK